MKTELRVVKHVFYISEIDPTIETSNKGWAKIIEWADEHPVIYRMVRGSKSAPYGQSSTLYHGWARGPEATADAVLHRIEVFLDDYENAMPGPNSFWRERARFALENHDEPGFKGAYFQQHAIHTDGKEYGRTSAALDYTEASKEMILDRFAAWMDPSYAPTTRITIDGINARVFSKSGNSPIVPNSRKKPSRPRSVASR